MSKRIREASDEDIEEEEHAVPPKQRRTAGAPSILNRLLQIQTRGAGPRLAGTYTAGRNTIDLDDGDAIRNRDEWVDNNGLVMDRNGVAQDEVLPGGKGPNDPYGPRSRAVFMAMKKPVEDDSLRPLLLAVAGAINEDIEALYEDMGVGERQRHNDIMDEWNRNEMRNLMTNISTKKDQMGKIRDELYRKQKIIDGHVQTNADLRALRDLANVAFPNAARQQDYQNTYVNEDDSLRHGNFPLVHILAKQRQFVNRLANSVIDEREDAEDGQSDPLVDLDRSYHDSDLLSDFQQYFSGPRVAKVIDNKILSRAFTKCEEYSKRVNKDTGISLRHLVPWIRWLDWYIWLRDEMLVGTPHFKLDFHDPNAVRVPLSASSLVQATLTASVDNYLIAMFLMKQMQASRDHTKIWGGPYAANQYDALLKAAKQDTENIHGWYTFFEKILPAKNMENTTATIFKAVFASSLRNVSKPNTTGHDAMDIDWTQKTGVWQHLETWKTSVADPLDRMITYLDLNNINRDRIIHIVRDVVQRHLDTGFASNLFDNKKVNYIERLTDPESVIEWTIYANPMEVTFTAPGKGPSTWYLLGTDGLVLHTYLSRWRFFLDVFNQGHYFADFTVSNIPHIDDMHKAFDVLTDDGKFLAHIEDILDVLWDKDLRDDKDMLHLFNMGGYYASGIHLLSEKVTFERFKKAYVVQHMPTDILIGLATTIMPQLLAPLEFVILDILNTQNAITLPPDWPDLRNQHLDAVFPLLPDGTHTLYAHKDILSTHRIVNAAVARISADSFQASIGPTLGVIQENFRAYTTNRAMVTILTHGYNWLLPSILLSAYMSQRTFSEQEQLRTDYNKLYETFVTVEDEYQRMARGDRPDIHKQKRDIRELVHEPDPTWLMTPMFTGKLRLKPAVMQAMDKAMLDVRTYCPSLSHMTLDDLAHVDPNSGLLTRYAEYLAAAYALKRLVWPDRYKKDKEYTISPIIRKDGIEPLKLYRADKDTLWHQILPGRWPLKQSAAQPLGNPRRMIGYQV